MMDFSANKNLPATMKTGWRRLFAPLYGWKRVTRNVVSWLNAPLNQPRPVPVRVKVEIQPDRREYLPKW